VQVLSHRGYWETPDEKNTADAFERSFRLGFGTETDVRDLNGRLVISHDPPLAGVLTFDEFLEIYSSFESRPTLALNVKADGLQTGIAEALSKRSIENYFVFDMSVPDMLRYFNEKLKVFTRQSDLESDPICLSESDGIWVDTLRSVWIRKESIDQAVATKKQICIVSPELHGRPHEELWQELADWGLATESNIMICTDFPESAAKLLTA
jgi:hypothetical protein